MAPDEILDEMRGAGTPDSEGRFTLDPRVALEKLRQYRLADPHEYVLALVAAAVRSGATRFEARGAAGELRVEFDGQPFTAAELGDLFARMLSGDARRAVLDLAAGVHGATVVARSVTVESGGTRLEVQGDRMEMAEAQDLGFTAVRLRGGGAVRALTGLLESLPEQDLLAKRASLAPLDLRCGMGRGIRPVDLGDVVIWRNVLSGLPEADLPSVPPEVPLGSGVRCADGFEAVLGLGAPAAPPLRLVVAGVEYPFPVSWLTWPELTGVVAAPDLKLDLSRGGVVQDATLRLLVQRVDAHAAEMVVEAAVTLAGRPVPEGIRSRLLMLAAKLDALLPPGAPERLPLLALMMQSYTGGAEDPARWVVGTRLLEELGRQGRLEEAADLRRTLRADLGGLVTLAARRQDVGLAWRAADLRSRLADEPREALRAHSMTAEVLGWWGREPECIAAWRQAVEAARRLGEPDLLAEVLHGLGVALRRQGWLEQALPLHEEAHALLPDARSHWLLASACVARGDLAAARDHYEAAREGLHEAWSRRAFDGGTEALLLEGHAAEALARCAEAMAARGWGGWTEALEPRARGEDGLLVAVLPEASRHEAGSAGWLGRILSWLRVPLVAGVVLPDLRPAVRHALARQRVEGEADPWPAVLKAVEQRYGPLHEAWEAVGWHAVHHLRRRGQAAEADGLWARLDGVARWRDLSRTESRPAAGGSPPR